jgi:hypothetical protein
MDVSIDAGWASASEGATVMADEITGMRKCIGSARFGIEPHEAPVEDFPRQPSQKDGLGRMCKVHWNQYTAGLARDAKARKAAAEGAEESRAPEAAEPTVEPDERVSADGEVAAAAPQPVRKRKRPGVAATPAAGSQGDAG